MATSTRESFQIWSDRFLYSRLSLARVMGAAGMWVFVGLDYILHAESVTTLLLLRGLSVLLLFSTAVFDKTALARKYPYLIALIMIWSATVPLSHMTVYLGGFKSDYYLGVIMIHTGAAVMLPWRWQLHVFAQLGSMAYWFTTNAMLFGLGEFYPLGLEALFVQISFYMLVDLSIFFYVYRFREHYAARQQLEETLELLTSREQNKNEYFNTKADEIRGYLRTIGNRIEDGIVQSDKDKLNQYRSILTSARNSTRRVSSIMEDVLDLYSLEVKAMRPNIVGVDSDKVVMPLVQDFAEQDLGKLEINIESKNGIAFRSDPKKLAKVLFLVASYLAAVSRDKKVSLKVQLLPGKKEEILFHFSTSSVGSTPEDRVRLFMPYYLSPGSDSGLGLILARYLARLLGGNLIAGGNFGESASFRLRLPRYGPNQESEDSLTVS